MAKKNSVIRHHWKQLIEQQIESGQTASNFCLINNLKKNQFSYYKSALFQAKPKKTTAFAKVLETEIPEEAESNRIVLYFKDLSLCFEGSPNPQIIASLCVLLSSQK